MDPNRNRSGMFNIRLIPIFIFSILGLGTSVANEANWQYPSDLNGLVKLYFGLFASVDCSARGMTFTGKEGYSLGLRSIGGGAYELREKDGSTRFLGFLDPGRKINLPLASGIVFFLHDAASLSLRPLPEDLSRWGFDVRFIGMTNVRGEPAVDTALVLLLKDRDGEADGNMRTICVMPRDLDAARRIVAGGGFVPDVSARKEEGMIVLSKEWEQGAPKAVAHPTTHSIAAVKAPLPTAEKQVSSRWPWLTGLGVLLVVVAGLTVFRIFRK